MIWPVKLSQSCIALAHIIGIPIGNTHTNVTSDETSSGTHHVIPKDGACHSKGRDLYLRVIAWTGKTGAPGHFDDTI